MSVNSRPRRGKESDFRLIFFSAAGLSRRPRVRTLKTIFDQLLAGIGAADEEQRDISCLGKLYHSMRAWLPLICTALKSVVAEMPRDERLVEPFVRTINEQILAVLTQVCRTPLILILD